MIQESLHPQNITVLKVTMLMMELKIHEAKKMLELQEKSMNPRSQSEMPRSLLNNGQKNVTAILALVESVLHPLQVKIPAQQWTEEHCSHPCSG